MAKKKNDEFDENDDLNQDFNSDDDSFGLPDVEYEPLSEDDSSDTTDDFSSSSDDYATVEDSTEEESSTTEESTYIPGSYTPPQEESNAGKIIAIVLVVLLAAVAIWYFGFYRPAQVAEEQARIEAQKKEQAEAKRLADQRAEEQRAREEAQRQAEAEASAAEEEQTQEGTIETISSRTGRYYVVVASALDGDLAMDYAKKRQADGLNTFIIEPYGTAKFHRVAAFHFGSWNDAEAKANELKGEYGDGVWVMKY